METLTPLPAPGPVTNRRRLPDRRRKPTSLWGAFTTPGRRRGFRRAEEGENAYVDLPTPRVALWALAVVAFCAVDALLTLIHIEAGGKELIPTMRFALNFGGTVFVVSKMAFTVVGVVVLTVHQNFRLARQAFGPIFVAYAALMLYHLYLVIVR